MTNNKNTHKRAQEILSLLWENNDEKDMLLNETCTVNAITYLERNHFIKKKHRVTGDYKIKLTDKGEKVCRYYKSLRFYLICQITKNYLFILAAISSIILLLLSILSNK